MGQPRAAFLFCALESKFMESLKDLIQNEDVKPKLQCIMNNPSFSMVTVQSEDSGITWETSSSRCSTPWASETSTTSDLYSMESSPVGSPPGKVIFIMDEGKIIRKRKRKASNRVPMATSLKGGQGNKKRDSSGMQRQEQRTVLGDVQASVLNVEQVEAQDTDEEMLDDKEDLEDTTEEPVKRAPIRSIFRESRLRKVGPILGGPVQARIQLFNSIFGGTGPAPETLEKTRTQRSSSVSGDSEQLLETSVKERLQKFRSLSEAARSKTFQRTRSRNLETPSERRRREQRQQSTAQANQSYSSPTTPLEKQFTNKGDVSSENIKPNKMKDKPSRFSSFGAETTLQHKERKDRQSLSETPNQESGHPLKSCPPEEARKQQNYSPAAKTSITEQTISASSEADDKLEKQVLLPSAENASKKPDQSLVTASDHLDKLKEQEIQPNSAPQSVSEDFVSELDRKSTQPILPTASLSEHPEKEAQKSAVQSYLPSAPSAIPQSSETAQSESEHVLLPHSVDETEKEETECHSSTSGLAENEPSGLFYSAKKPEGQKTPPPETQNVHLEKQTKAEQDFSSSLQETEEQGIQLNAPIPEKIDSKYFGISYPIHTETKETQKTSAINKAVDLDHPDFSSEKNKQAESMQMEMEHPDFSYSSKEIEESERTQMETEHLDFSFSKEETVELEGAQMETEHPDFSFSREEMEEPESAEPETEQPDFSYSRGEMEELEGAQTETKHQDFSYSRVETEELESEKLETEYPELFFSTKETDKSESAKLETEHPDFLYSIEEIEESESAQLEVEHPDFSFSREKMEESESATLETEHPDFSYSSKEIGESESVELKTEHPDFSYSREELVESESAQPETEQPDFSLSREEVEEPESVQLEADHLDFSHFKEETEELESAQLETEQPDISYSMEETEESENTQLEKEYPEFFSKEETEESESAQLEIEHPDFSFSREEMEEPESAELETEQPDFSYSREEIGESESAQLEDQEFLFHREEKENQKSVHFEQPESYSPEEAEQEEAAQLAVVPSDLSCLMEEVEKENTRELQSVDPDTFGSTRTAKTQQTGYLETAHSDLPYSTNKTRQQELAQADVDNSLTSYFGNKGEQPQPIQQDSQPGGKLYSHAKRVQGETTQLQSEHPLLSYSTGKEQQHKTSPLRAEQPEISYSSGKTEQQEILQPKLEQADLPYAQGETAQEAVQRDLEGPESSCFVSEAEQHENVQLDSENRDFSFSTGEVMLEGVKSGSLGSTRLINRAKPWEMAQMEQEQPLPSCSSAGSQQQETPPLSVAQPDISYSFGRTEQQDTVQRELEQQETAQQIAMEMEMEMEYSDLSETLGKEEPQVIDQINLAQQGTAQPELVHPSLSYPLSEEMQEEMQTEPAHPEQPFCVSTEIQEEMTQYKSEQPSLSSFTGKTGQQEIVHTELGQTFLQSSSGKEALLEMEVSSEYPDLSHSFHEAEQPKKLNHPTLPFRLKQQETAPLVMEHPDFSCDRGEAKPGDTVEQESGRPEHSWSMEETKGKSEHLVSPENLGAAAQDETMEVELKYSNLTCSGGQKSQEETSQLDSKYPDLSFFFGKAKEQATHEFESKHQELPKMARKRASPATAQVESKHPNLTYSLGKENEPEIAPRDMKHPDLSHCTDETNQQEVIVLDQKHRKISVDREKQQQTTKQQLEQEKLSDFRGKTEQLKHAQEDLELSNLPFSNDRPDDKIAPPEAGHTGVVHPLDNIEVQRQESEQTGLTYPFGKAEEKTVHPEVKIPHLAYSMGMSEEEMVEPGQEHPALPYSASEAGELQTAQLKSKHTGLAYSLDKVQETTQLGLDVHDKTEQLPPAQLELGHTNLADKVGQQGMEHTALGHPNEGQPVTRAEHPQAAKEKLGAPDASSHSGKAEQREMTETEPRHLDLSYSIDKVQTQATTQLALGKQDLSSWSGKTKQAQTAEGEQSGFLYSSTEAAQGEKAQSELGHSQLSYSVSEAEQETAHVKSNRSDLYAGRLEHHEIIQTEAELMDLSCSVAEKWQPQMAEVDLEYPDTLHSAGTVQRQEKILPEQEKPGDFSSSLSKEEQWVGAGVQAKHPELQQSMGKIGLQYSQAKSEYADLSFSVGAAEPHETTQPELKEYDLLQSFVKTKPSWAAPQEAEHPEVSDAMGKVPHPDLSSSVSELEVKQERGSYTSHPEETVRLKLEQPMLSSSRGTAEQSNRAPLEAEFPGFLYSPGKKEPQETTKQELEHSGLPYSTDKTQRQETTQLGLGQPDLSSCPAKTEQPQTVQVEAEDQDVVHSTGETEWEGTAQAEAAYPDLSHSSDKVEQPPATQQKSEQLVTPHPTGRMEQQGLAHPEQQLPGLSYPTCKTPSEEATQMDLGQQDLTYALGKADEVQTVQGELEHTGLLHSSSKREKEIVLPELRHPQLSYPVTEAKEEATHRKSDYPDLSYSISQQEHHEIEQAEVEEMDLSYPAGKSEHSQPTPKVLQQPEPFGKLEEKRMAQPGFLHSLGEENQKPASQLDLVQPDLSHLLGKTEKQEAAQVPSDFSYSTGKAEQLQSEQRKSKYPDWSYSLGKTETCGMKPPDLLYSCGKAEQPQTAQLEHPETPRFMGEMEQRDGAQPELPCLDLPYAVVETEQPETPSPSVSYAFGRTEDQGTVQLGFEQSDLLSSTDKAEKDEMAPLRAGHSEKRDPRTTSSLTAQLETEQDLSISTEKAESEKNQLYSSLTEQTVSVPLGVSHSISETKPEGRPKISPVAGGLSPKHLDLSDTRCKTEQSETAQPESGFVFARNKAENTKSILHFPVAAQSEAEHVILPETERELTPHYFHTAAQSESEQLNLSYSTDKAETLESQGYLTVPSKLESEPSVPFYSADETYQQEIPPHSKPASEYLVPTWSLAEQEKQSMRALIPQSAQPECKHVIPPHDGKELQQIQLCSPKPASLKTVQSESMSLKHTKDQDKQESQDHLVDTKYLSSEQLRSPLKFTAEQGKQEMQPDVQVVPRLVTTESKVTAVADQQAVSSDSFVPFHTSPEKSVSVAFTDDEEKQNIPSSLSDVVGMLGKQSNIVSGSYAEGEDRREMQRYLADQKHTPLEHLGAVSSDLAYETVTDKTQQHSGEHGSPSSVEIKSLSSSSDEKQNPDIPSFGLASWLVEEVKARSISPVRAAEVDRQGINLSPNEASEFGSKKSPAGSCTEFTVHGATESKEHMFRVSHSASSEISHRMSSDTSHRMQRYGLPSLVGDKPDLDKVPDRETSIGNTTKMEVMQHTEVENISEMPEHYLRGEKEVEHVSTVEDRQDVPETTEQKDLFNIISEGYEILNIHAPTHISSVDQEESEHMPDKLEYLETNPSFKRKLADDGHGASGTTTEISEGSMLGKPASHELKELVKNDGVEETGETQEENPMFPENNNNADTNNGLADMDYFEKYTLIDDKSPIKPHFERPSSLFPVAEDPNEPVEEATTFKESTEVDTLEEEFSLLEDLDEVFYGTVKGESKMQSYPDAPNPLPPQKSIDMSSKKVTNVEDERKSPGTPLFDSEEGVLERSLLFPTTVAAVNPELLEEPPALSFLYKDLYAEAVGEKTKDETPSDEESGNSNASFPSRNSDTDDGTGIYFEKYILKDEIPSKAIGPQKDQIPEDESFSGGISVQISEDKHKQGPGDVQHVSTEVLTERSVVKREKVQVDSDIQATICKPTHAIPFGSKVILSGARADTTEQREEENIPVETTEELPEQSSHQAYSQLADYQGGAYQEAGNKQEEQHDVTAVPQMETYVPYVRTPVEDSEDDQYTQENLSGVPTLQQTDKPHLQGEEQQPDVYEDLAESMDYDVITQEELLQDEISSQFTHEELLFEDRDSFEHAGDSYEFVNEPEQRTPVEIEDSGFVVMYPEKSTTNIPQVESPQKELKKAQTDTYCYHCKCPISAIDKLFGEHKDHEVTTLDDAAAKMKDQLGELLVALEEKSMKIEEFVSDIESLFNSVEENCKKNAELLEKQNEEMLKKMVAQYDEKSENFEEVKKMKMEYLYEQMVNFQQTVDSAKETLETTVKETEELDGFVFLNSSKELNKRLLSAMDTTLSLEKVPSAFSLFEHYADSPEQSNQHSLKQVAVPQTPTVVPQEPNSATSTSIAVYWTVNDGDAIDCFQVYCMEEPQSSKDAGALVEEYRVTVKESHCILEDLEPDRCYSVWVMAVNTTGCSLPSEKAIFKTAPAVPTIKAEDCTVCWDTATVRWRAGSSSVESFTLEYCRQHSPEGEGLRSFAGIKRPELKVSLEPNVNYFFYLRAVNLFGTSEQSEAALISTKGTRFCLLSDTAHPALQISSNATVIRLPEKAKFTGIASVLGELLPAQGHHYWETVVSACRSYRIGICYEATSRSSVLGLSDTSWCMRCCPTQTSLLYRFLHTGVMSDVRVTEHPARIGILLDYSGGRLLFFNAEKGLVLFSIRHKFTDAAHPAFALEKAGALTLRTGMELPEFVKQS